MENIHDDEHERHFFDLCRVLSPAAAGTMRRLLSESPELLVSLKTVERALLCCVHAGALVQLSLLVRETGARLDEDAKARMVHAVCVAERALPMYTFLVEQQGWPVHVLDDDGNSCFHMACRAGNLAVCRRLVDKVGLDPTLVTDHDRSALHCAVRSGSLEVVRYLMEELRIDPVNIESRSVRSSLVLSKGGTLHGSFEIFERGDAVSQSPHDGWSLLHYAAASGSLAVVEYLLSSPYGMFADIHSCDASGQSALHVAAGTATPQTKDLLVFLMRQQRMSPNVADRHGRTPLHVACESGTVESVEALLSNGAHPLATHSGAMPYQLIHPSRAAHDTVRFLCEAYNPVMSFHAIPWEWIGQFCRDENKLGNGKCGVVYRGELHSTPVAIKTFIDSDRYFKHEVGVLSRIHHPSIVCFLAASLEGTMCLVMEYLPGGTCREALRDPARTVSWATRQQWLGDVARAVAWLHNQKPFILHRDLKSNNVLLSAEGRAKLSDFGLASVENNIFVRKVYAATLPAGEPSSKKADVYSFSLMMLEFFTSQPATVHNCNQIMSAVHRALSGMVPSRQLVLIEDGVHRRPDFGTIIMQLGQIADNDGEERAAFDLVKTYFDSHVDTGRIREEMDDDDDENSSYISFGSPEEFRMQDMPFMVHDMREPMRKRVKPD